MMGGAVFQWWGPVPVGPLWSRSHSSLQGGLTPLFQEALGNAPKSCDVSGERAAPALFLGPLEG